MNAKSNLIHTVVCGLGVPLGIVLGTVLAPATDARAAQDGASDPEPPAISAEGTEQVSVPAGDDRPQEGPAPVDIRERQAFGQTITEYERAGRVFLMTVKPRVGPTQYWNDPDGDGQFQRSTSDNIDESVNLPKWRLGGW